MGITRLLAVLKDPGGGLYGEYIYAGYNTAECWITKEWEIKGKRLIMMWPKANLPNTFYGEPNVFVNIGTRFAFEYVICGTIVWTGPNYTDCPLTVDEIKEELPWMRGKDAGEYEYYYGEKEYNTDDMLISKTPNHMFHPSIIKFKSLWGLQNDIS